MVWSVIVYRRQAGESAKRSVNPHRLLCQSSTYPPASRIALAYLSSIHNDTPDHGCNVPSVVKSGQTYTASCKFKLSMHLNSW